MPIYEFECPDHGKFDCIAKIGDVEAVCHCGKRALKSVTPCRFAVSRGAVEVKQVGNQGVIVEHSGQHYFRPNPAVINREAGQEGARKHHKKALEKEANKRDLTKDEKKVLIS